MSTTQNAAGDYIANEVDFQRRLREMQLWGYAMAVGLPSVPAAADFDSSSTQSPSTITNNVTTPAAPATAPAPIATGSGLSGLAKTAIAAAALTGAGGIGVGIANLFSSTPPPAVQTAPPGQVTIGISPDGQLINPNAAP